MFQKMKARMLHILPAVLVSVLLVTGVLHAVWTDPSVAPPDDNVSAPLNIGSTGQIKWGNLALNANGIEPNALLIPFGRVGIGPVASVDNPSYDSLKLVDLGNSGRIVRVKDPVDLQDVATKAYVDAAGGGSSGLKIVKADCTTPAVAGGTCTATADCGSGWQIVACAYASLPGTYSIPAAYFHAGRSLYTDNVDDARADHCNPGSGTAIGEQDFSIGGASKYKAVVALCTKQ